MVPSNAEINGVWIKERTHFSRFSQISVVYRDFKKRTHNNVGSILDERRTKDVAVWWVQRVLHMWGIWIYEFWNNVLSILVLSWLALPLRQSVSSFCFLIFAANASYRRYAVGRLDHSRMKLTFVIRERKDASTIGKIENFTSEDDQKCGKHWKVWK